MPVKNGENSRWCRENLPDWLRRLYPFEPRSLDRGQGVRLSFVDEGPRRDEAVVLLHGNPTWSFHYRDLIRKLAGAGLRCVAPDHIGMGLSDKPQEYPYRLTTHIDNVTALVGQLGLKHVHLVVHDWGGAIGFGWAVRNPEKVGRIVILNTAAFPAARMPWRIRICRTPLFGEWLVRGLNGFAGPATWMAVKRRPLPPDVKRGYLFPYDSWAHRVAVARFVADIPMDDHHPSMGPLKAIAGGLGAFQSRRVLLVWGGADFCFDDRFFAEWSRIYPASEALHIHDAGHYVLEDAGEQVIPAIGRFLGGS
ncbi:MAG: alpha/beta hydrolase [Verrucomicrobia bacterium RIFCSPLOWO2_12_FULL_64_8]|nr:MAG: alpha/beta hydrolase [Verrucomicrobia bacterium RIFCSPLOWO2_12_FULL_64_8]